MGKTRTEHMYDCEVVRGKSEARATLKGFLRIRGCSLVDGEEGKEERDLRSRPRLFLMKFFPACSRRLLAITWLGWLSVRRASPALVRKYPRTPVPISHQQASRADRACSLLLAKPLQSRDRLDRRRLHGSVPCLISPLIPSRANAANSFHAIDSLGSVIVGQIKITRFSMCPGAQRPDFATPL